VSPPASRIVSLAVVAIIVVAGACSSSTGIGSPSGPASPATPAATATAVSSIAPSSAPSPSATPIGQPADDGARVVGVETVGPRVRDLTIESPAVGTTIVRLLLPAAFDAQPTTRWPVLYLLHGANGSHEAWMGYTDVESLVAPLDLLVVMPDAGDLGFYSDWWNGGRGGQPMWETFHMTELPQLLERGWRSSDRRVVAGLSMGGFGAMLYAARHPGMFKAAASFSGAVDPIGGELDIGDENLWGDPVAQADVWRAHDPVNLAKALKGTVLYVAYGDGGQGPLDPSPVSSDDLEPWIADQNRTFVARLHKLGIPVIVDAYGPGAHDWPYWERALHRSLPLLLKALGQ
jgi:diacylglycerol O-acyltransferase/trehalose O-mycolyltransferase